MIKAAKLPLEQAWNNWVNCLKGDDINSIFQQISWMIWDTAIFRVIVEGRQVQIQKNPKAPAVNGSLHSFIDRNYFQTQVTVIRRLTDKSYGLTGNRGVYSIVALIKDIRNYRDELTRAMFFRFRNMPYDYTEIKISEEKFLRNHPVGEAIFVPPEFDWESIAEAHQTFDRLSITNQKIRKPDDVISDRVFIRLEEKLVACQEISNYVDKFVAHSAIPESRESQNVNVSEITFEHVWKAQKIIFQVAEFLSTVFFSEGHMALPLENPYFFDYWESPIFEDSSVHRVSDALKAYRKETETWHLNGSEDIWQSIVA